MAILEIIEIAKNLLSTTEIKAKAFDYKSTEHDNIIFQAEEIKNFIIEAESCLRVPGVKEKLDYRDDIPFYHNLFSYKTDEAAYETFKYIEKAVRNTFLWAKKLSWIGDWDLNFNGRHSIMSVVFVSDPEIPEYNVPNHYFHRGENITRKHFKIELKSSAANLTKPSRVDFSDDWEKIEFPLNENDDFLTFKATVFKWDRSKFSGMVYDRPFYAERTTDYFGSDYIVYYSANY